MDNLKNLEKVSVNAVTEYIRDRLLIVGEGNGNLLRINSRNFIVTCRHVAEPFFRNNFPYAVLRDNVRILRKNIELISKTNSDLDLAIMEITSEINPRGVYNINDFEIIEDFLKYNWNSTDLILCGLPVNLAFKSERGINYPYMTFITLPHKNIENKDTSKFIFAEYPKDKEHIEIQHGLRTLIPEPYGISGSFILKIRTFRGPKTEIWNPSLTKVIGVQQKWYKSGNYVKGINIKYLMKLLEESKII